MTSGNGGKKVADFVPEGPLEHVFLASPELGDATAIFKLKLRFPEAD